MAKKKINTKKSMGLTLLETKFLKYFLNWEESQLEEEM